MCVKILLVWCCWWYFCSSRLSLGWAWPHTHICQFIDALSRKHGSVIFHILSATERGNMFECSNILACSHSSQIWCSCSLDCSVQTDVSGESSQTDTCQSALSTWLTQLHQSASGVQTKLYALPLLSLMLIASSFTPIFVHLLPLCLLLFLLPPSTHLNPHNLPWSSSSMYPSDLTSSPHLPPYLSSPSSSTFLLLLH